MNEKKMSHIEISLSQVRLAQRFHFASYVLHRDLILPGMSCIEISFHNPLKVSLFRKG